MEYAIEVAQACHEQGIKTVAVTAGYINAAPRADFFTHMDAANIDLKGLSDAFYRRLCAGRLQPVLDTLQYVKEETGTWLEITNLVIPDHNDSIAELDALTKWVVNVLGTDVPLHFSAFHPDFKMRDVPRTSPETLVEARRIALENGVRYVYTGNVRDEQGESTYCHVCGALLIARDWYAIGDWELTADGACPECGTPCSGYFDRQPGDWGARRQPVRLASFVA